VRDREALDRITEEMSGVEWSADTLEIIAQIVEMTGRKILPPDEGGDGE